MSVFRSFIAGFCFAAFFVSCASGPGIPGENRVVISNIAAEYYAIAEGYFNLKNYAKAADYYKKVLTFPEYKKSAEYKLARSHVFLKQWSEAESLYRKLLKSDSENSNLKLSLAYVLASSGDMAAALEIYENLLTRDYAEPVLLQNMILLYISMQDFDKAEEKLNLYGERFPEDEKRLELAEKLQKAREPAKKEDNQTDTEASVPESPSPVPSA